MDYNNYTATELDQKWAITPDAVVRLCGGDRDRVERFQKAHHLAISDYYAKHSLSPNHNSSVGNKAQKIEDLIQL